MLLMLMVVLCYTICSLSDKYAVAKIKFNGNELTFLMAAATAVFMNNYVAVCCTARCVGAAGSGSDPSVDRFQDAGVSDVSTDPSGYVGV